MNRTRVLHLPYRQSVDVGQITKAYLLSESQRLLQTFIAVVLLIFPSSPFLILAALAIIIENRGKASCIFKQMRVGKDGVLFEIYKLRTCTDDGTPTTVGKVLRALKIDEIPQLVNIMKGDMNFVGPRPLIPKEAESIPYMPREGCKPGLTGIEQISGRRRADGYKTFYRYDQWYVENKCTHTDMYIIYRTFAFIGQKIVTFSTHAQQCIKNECTHLYLMIVFRWRKIFEKI